MSALGAPSVTGVVFDLDGTLVDSREDLAAAVNRLRRDLALPELPLAEVVAKVGGGARELVRRSLPATTGDEALSAALSRFLVHYDQVCLDVTRPYPGITDLLGELAPRLPLAVLTNKPEALSRKILAGLGLAPAFQAIVGGDTLPVKKPDPQGLLWLAEHLGCPPTSLVLVGDSPIDFHTAQAAGARAILVEWGFTAPDTLAELPAPKVPDSGELAKLLRS
ncbi:MAG TPA: HAD-IA family hydrolase [Thermoanaerobaculia bacterium]|nr:HAD-IA family hydrolase [Thermoanaerobaculia bacterium]